MKAQVESTNSAISRHLTLDDETSALFRLKRELLEVLQKHEDRQRLFQQEVQVTLEKMQTRKATAARSTEHGLEFESRLFDLVNEEAVRAGDLAMFMGDKPGVIRGCKKGDIVVELNIDHVAGGAKIAIEAKEDASYNIKKALVEIDEASKNREAQFGLFVFSRRLAPEGLEAISRHGNAIVIVWDPEDRQTDLFVKLGLSVAKALCTRQAREREAISVDFSAIDQSLLNINKELTQLEEINTWTTTIQNNSEKILERMRGARKKLDKQILLLQEALLDIRQTLGDDSTEV